MIVLGVALMFAWLFIPAVAVALVAAVSHDTRYLFPAAALVTLALYLVVLANADTYDTGLSLNTLAYGIVAFLQLIIAALVALAISSRRSTPL